MGDEGGGDGMVSNPKVGLGSGVFLRRNVTISDGCDEISAHQDHQGVTNYIQHNGFPWHYPPQSAKISTCSR